MHKRILFGFNTSYKMASSIYYMGKLSRKYQLNCFLYRNKGQKVYSCSKGKRYFLLEAFQRVNLTFLFR